MRLLYIYIFLISFSYQQNQEILKNLEQFPKEKHFFQLERFLKEESSEGLTPSQRQQLACTISNELSIPTERVITSDGYSCGQTIKQNYNEDLQELQQESDDEEEEFYDYFVIMPDLYAAEGSMEDCISAIESENFENAIQVTIENKTLFGDTNEFSISEISAIQIEKQAVKPIIDAPDCIAGSDNLTFLFKGANNSNGYIFGGIAEKGERKPDKLEVQFRDQYNYSFCSYKKRFYKQDIEESISFVGLKECTEYVYYWLVSNEDLNSFLYCTVMKDEFVRTQCFGYLVGIYFRQIVFLIISIIIFC